MLETFFLLLRSGMYGRSVSASDIPSCLDWNALLKMAARQTVTGIITDAVFRLPESVQPPKEVLDALRQFAFRNINSHLLLNSTLQKTVSLLRSNNIDTVLLKGQGLALCYPHPEMRQCGDIDLYICGGQYERACELVASHLHDAPEPPFKETRHTLFRHGTVFIELHSKASRMSMAWQDRRFQRWILSKLEGHSRLQHVDFNGTAVALPPADFNVFFIFYHTWRHFLHGGIGLRQLCDLALFLHTDYPRIDLVALHNRLEEFGLLKAWQLVGHILVSQLGLPPREMPFYNTDVEKQSRSVLRRILRDGNFGYYSNMNTSRWSDMPYYRRKLITLWYYTKDFLQLFHYAPLQLTCDYLATLRHTGKRVLQHSADAIFH